MLGLMLGGMIFATASSVNTTLNLAASVITNDIYKVLRPKAGIKEVMRVAKLSTFLFGLGTIAVALIVPAAGGIVNVVLSIGAVTGCSLYGPPIWAIFSKRHTGKSILWITAVSLGINVAIKFFGEMLFGAALSRANEMLLGAVLPLAMLLAYEIYAKSKNTVSQDYILFKENIVEENVEEQKSDQKSEQNMFGLKVLSVTLAIVGVMIIVLGILSESSKTLVITVGGVVLALASVIHPNITIKSVRK